RPQDAADRQRGRTRGLRRDRRRQGRVGLPPHGQEALRVEARVAEEAPESPPGQEGQRERAAAPTTLPEEGEGGGGEDGGGGQQQLDVLGVAEGRGQEVAQREHARAGEEGGGEDPPGVARRAARQGQPRHR